MNRFTTVTLAAVTCALVGVAGIASADAATVTTSRSATPTSSSTGDTDAARLGVIQAHAAADIAGRVLALNRTIPAVTANAVITSGDKGALLATLNGDLSGLTALGTKIAADTTVSVAAADYQTIFTTYRVYALALPQVRYAAAADDLTAAVLPRLSDADTQLAALLAGTDSAKNTPAVQAAMADLSKQITAATAATSGLSATVLAYTPAQYDANHALLAQPRATLVGAQADVRTARADIATVLAALK